MKNLMVRHEQKIGTNKVTYYRSTPDSPHQIFISNKVFGKDLGIITDASQAMLGSQLDSLTDEQLKDLAKFLCLRVSELDK